MSESTPSPAPPSTPRKRRWRRRIAGTIVLIFILLNTVAFFHARAMTHMAASGERTSSPRALSAWGKIKVLFTGVTMPKPVNRVTPSLPYTTHTFATRDGQMLEAWLIRAADSRGLVAMFHGYTACKSTLLNEANVIHDAGFDVLLVDFRASGGSSGNITTIGFNEAIDVVTTLDWVKAKELSQDKPIIAFGDSMGAAAIMRSVSVEGAKFDALILDQPYSTLYSTTKGRFRSMGLPSFPFAGLLVFWGGVQNGFWGFNMKPVDFAKDIRCPTLYIHGEGDPWIEQDDAQSIIIALTCPKQILAIPTDRHDALRPRDPAKWDAGVQAFLRELK